mmetsp:Transcript_8220/g.13025  ORF Transcript_8220/g.13025 Transcript_8220/m.13025 type:complete len:237 (-) Transcript_8220:68-778(-)
MEWLQLLAANVCDHPKIIADGPHHAIPKSIVIRPSSRRHRRQLHPINLTRLSETRRQALKNGAGCITRGPVERTLLVHLSLQPESEDLIQETNGCEPTQEDQVISSGNISLQISLGDWMDVGVLSEWREDDHMGVLIPAYRPQRGSPQRVEGHDLGLIVPLAEHSLEVPDQLPTSPEISLRTSIHPYPVRIEIKGLVPKRTPGGLELLGGLEGSGGHRQGCGGRRWLADFSGLRAE